MPEEEKTPGKTVVKKAFSVAGLIVGVSSLALVFVGGDIAKHIYPDPPAPPLLTRRDMTPINEGEIRDAVVDFAAEVAAESSRKVADATVETGKKTARGIWSRVKRLTGEEDAESATEGETEAGSAVEISGDDNILTAEEDEGQLANEPTETKADLSAEAPPEKGGKLGWRDVTVNIINPGSPEQKRLVGWFEKATLLGGLAALLLGMVGWIRHEDQRICVCAGFVGVLAMAWVYIMMAIGIAIVAVILGPILSALN